MVEQAEVERMMQTKVLRTMLACARADRLIAACLDGPGPELAELQGHIDHIRNEAAQFVGASRRRRHFAALMKPKRL